MVNHERVSFQLSHPPKEVSDIHGQLCAPAQFQQKIMIFAKFIHEQRRRWSPKSVCYFEILHHYHQGKIAESPWSRFPLMTYFWLDLVAASFFPLGERLAGEQMRMVRHSISRPFRWQYFTTRNRYPYRQTRLRLSA